VPAGTSRKQAETALNSTYAGLLEEQAKTEKRNAKNLDRFLKTRLTLKDGKQGNSSFRDGSVNAGLDPDGGHRIGAPDRDGERRQSAAGAQRAAPPRTGHPRGPGREPPRVDRTDAHRSASARRGRRAWPDSRWDGITLSLLINKVIGGADPIHFLTPELDWTMLGFGVALSVVTGLLFGLYPAWEAARQSMAVTLKDESGQSSGTKGAASVRKVLVCAQVTISLVLLIPTGLFLKSLVNLMHVDLGMRTENLIGFSVSPSLNGYKNEQTRALIERIRTDLAGIPGCARRGCRHGAAHRRQQLG
jgi:hypothetical protein